MVITSSFFYYKGHFIDWRLAILCGIGGSIGGYIGAKLLKKLPDKILKIAFTIFLIYVSLNIKRKVIMDRKILEKSEWKNKNKQYLFELQKFLDLADNIKDENLKKVIIYQMIKCDQCITDIAEEIFKKLENDL